MKSGSIATGVALFATLAGSLVSRGNMLTNGGLEVTAGQISTDPTLVYSDGLIHASGTTHATALNGWTIGGASIDIVPNTYWQSTQGTYSVDLTGTTGIGSITQTVTGLTPGDVYELSFDFTVNPSDGGHGGESTWIRWLDVSMSNSTIPTFYFAGAPSGTQTAVNMQFVRRALDFTAQGTSTTITFAAIFPNNLPKTFPDGTPVLPNTVYSGPVVDNLDLEDISGVGNTAPLPEPATLGILASAGVMLLRRRR